ncbi:hypothetical protein LTR08_002609 [Meristemomyces frigidus]|nr:hypothetical protein LTR08_002609 [Meristemomyces frigidus]
MASRATCLLFKLPPEIRNNIYTLVLVSSREELIIEHTSSPALLRTCRQIREEASSVYYGRNTFLITNAERLCLSWLFSRPAIMRSHIKTIRLYTNCRTSGIEAFVYKSGLITRLYLELRRKGFNIAPTLQVFYLLDALYRPVWESFLSVERQQALTAVETWRVGWT